MREHSTLQANGDTGLCRHTWQVIERYSGAARHLTRYEVALPAPCCPNIKPASYWSVGLPAALETDSQPTDEFFSEQVRASMEAKYKLRDVKDAKAGLHCG